MIRKKLLKEILEILLASTAIFLFSFYALYITSVSILEAYLSNGDIALNTVQQNIFMVWIKSICLSASVFIFLSIFLFLFGQKISYLSYIIKSVEYLKQNNMDFTIKVEGNNELTQLAESINYLALSQRELFKQEENLKKEREEMIRSLSHDIRTPLTSILSYSDYIKNKENLTNEEFKSYINIIQTKAEQIKILTDKLLGKENKSLETIENGKLLMEQLAYEWEEILEEKFNCKIDLTNCTTFKCTFKIEDLRRIFDNIASNIEKYADQTKNVDLIISHKDQKLIIIQQNYIKDINKSKIESHKIGLNSIATIVNSYGGNIEIIKNNDIFKIKIVLDTIN